MTALRSFIFGAWQDAPIAAGDVPSIVHDAEARRPALRAMTTARFDGALDALREEWTRGGSARARFLASAPESSIGLSRPMIEWGLDRFALHLDPAVARSRAALQLAEAHPATAIRLRPEPLGILLHVVSGNVFSGPAEAMLASLLTHNVTIVKRPSGGVGFLDAFCESLASVAPDLADAVAVLGWAGGTEAIERPLAEAVDGIVIAADGETIAAYRRIAPPATALIEFGPRVSVAVVSRSARFSDDGLARDVALWDQLACTAAQNVYVQGEDTARLVAHRLSAALARLATAMPGGAVTLDERIDVARARHTAAFASALGIAEVFDTDSFATVVFERDPTFRPSPLRRSVYVKPFETLADLTAALSPTRGLLHTAGLAVDADERCEYEECLAALGVRRVCGIGCMNEPSPIGPHDGLFELQRFVRWVERAP